jgi:Glycosyltransferase family 87
LSAGAGYALIWVGFLAYLGVLIALGRGGLMSHSDTKPTQRLVWGAILALVILFAAVPPLLSHDVYSYVDYARLGVVHDLNPYVNAPSAAPADPAFADVTWTEATSAYGPLFTLLTYPLAWLPVDAAVWTLKAIAATSVLALAGLVAKLAAIRGVDPLRAAAFVGLNPLVLVHVVGGPHNDGLAMLLALVGCMAVLARREISAGAALVSAVAVKASAAFVAPFALLATRNSRPMGLKAVYISTFRPVGGMGRFAVGAIAATVVICTVACAAFGWHWLDAIGLAGENQDRTSYMSVPITMARLLGLDPDPVRATFLILFAALIAYLLAWTWRGGDWISASGWAALGLLLATAWLLPWYLIWVLPFAALSRDTRLQLLVLALTAFQLTTRIPV